MSPAARGSHRRPRSSTDVDERRLGLTAECQSCFGLCCVAPGFSASSDFAIDKPAGTPCPHLQTDFRCGIHSRLRPRGFAGCTVYDCFGAGQKTAQVTFGGQHWRRDPASASRMFEVFAVMRQLHEMLWYIAEALTLRAAVSLHAELNGAYVETERLTHGTAESLLELDVAAHRREISVLLARTSELVRAGAGYRRPDRAGADLIGADLAGADLTGVSLRGAYLIGADLAGADLRGADLIGADLRGADVSGADLTGSIFLTQVQVNAAKGDDRTQLPPALTRPSHWPVSPGQE